MAKQQIKINLLFDANTTAAQNNIQQLAVLLQQISTKTIVGVDSGSLQQAVSAAQQLQISLQNAVNVNTGKIDLMKLQNDLKASGTSLQTLTSQLRAVGPAGEQAFLKVANAVSQAEVPMVKANGLIKNFITTLANTAKWQAASSAIHGFMRMFQSATSHAKNLNKALTDIQIVSHASAVEMAQFAQTATKAASALNTTSTEYAKAALIFYQQGLSGDDVAERANTVIKLSQVTGESAAIVSDQMTAIWNNFDNGSHKLEYYADVLTKLGATTAASTDEVADGLEKFAAIAGTVGMEYETAAASIATVVAETRQSADVVGTAFKTIFARVQGLSLGETLDDGVDLNKYSEALSKVGVDVLTADGKLREMDDILEDLGEKWQGLGEETRVALAQVVGGTRQYSQMIALMDNWDKVIDNIDEAKNATGELVKQQEIWAHSYEASLTRLNQAKNELYESFVSDDFLIGWNDTITILIKSISDFIDKIGGIGPLIFALVGMFSKTLFPLITNGLIKISNMLAVHTGKAAQQVAAMQSQMSNSINQMIENTNFTNGMKKQLALTAQLLQEKQKLMLASRTMTEAQKIEAQSRLAVAEAMMTETMQILQQQDALEKQARAAQASLTSGKQRWDVARTAAEYNYRKRSTEMANPNETEDERLAREANDNWVLNRATNTGAGKLKSQAEAGIQFIQNQQQLQNWAPNIERANQQAAMYQPISSEDLSIRDKARALQAEQAKLLEKMGLTHGDINADVSKYVEGLMKARDVQKEIYEIANNNAEKAGVGTAKIKHDPSFGEGEEVGKVESTQLSKISANSEGAISFDETSGDLGMEASLTNYEKLYQVLGEQKVLQSELVAATQEVAAAREAAKGKTADYEAATIELVAAEKELADYEKKISKSGKTITDARKAELKQISKGSKEYKKLSKTEKDYVKIQEKIKKAVDNQAEAQKKAITQFTAQKKSYEDLATKAGATSDQMKQLTGAFDALESGSGNVDDQFKVISSVFKELGISTDGVSNDIIELGNKMQTMLAAAGYSDDQINILTQAFQQLANATPRAANGIKGAEGALGSLNGKAPTLTSSFGSMAQNTMTLAGNLMSLKSGIEGITTAFTEGGSAADIMQKVLTGILGIMPTIITFTNAAKAAQDRKNKSTREAVKANAAETISEGAKTSATWADTIANIANLMSNPWTIAIAAGIVIAISAVCAAFESKTEATKADTQANIESAESSNELSSKWAEQQDAMDGLIAKYKDLKAAGEEYQDTVDDIVEAVPDLINAYREAAKGLGIDISEGTAFYEAEQRLKNAAAAGNVEAIEQAQEGMDALIAPEAAEVAKKGYDASVKALGYKLQETEGSFSDNVYTAKVGGYLGLFETTLNSEETIAENILKEKMGSKYDTSAAIWEDVGGSISLDMSTSDQFVEDYEALLAARDKMKEKMTNEELADSGIYEEVNNLIESTKEEYDKVKEMQAEAQKYGVYDAKANLEAQGMDITEIDSLQKYHDYKTALLNDENVKGDPEAEAIAQQWLEANASVQDYILAEQKIGFIKDQTGNDLTAFYDTLEPDEKELFLNVDFNKYQSEEAITAEIHRLQKVAEQNDIKIKIKAIDTTKEALKDKDMTEDNWIQVRDSGIKWGKDGIIKFTEFLKMSYEEQSKYLQRIKDEQDSLLETNAEQTIDTLKQDLDTLASAFASGKYTGDLAQYTAERQAILDEIELLQGEAIIRNKMAESQEIARHELDESLIVELKEEFNAINSEIQILDEASKQITKATLSVEDLNEANKDAAIRYARLNAAIDDLHSNYDTYEDILKDFSKAATDADKAMIANSENGKALKKSIAGLLNVTEDFIDVDLLKAIDPKDFKKAAEGDEDAIERIRSAFIKLQAEVHDIDFDMLKTELDELQEGVIIDINADTMPLLYKLIAAKVAAGAGAQEIEDLLSGFNIDADVSGFIGSMDEMAAASAKAGTEVIENTSFSQEVEPTTVETIEPQEEIAYSTTYEPDTVSYTNKILKNGADDVVEVEETRTNLTKKVEATPVSGESVSTTTATAVTTSNAAGKTGKIKGVQIKNAHRSSGGKVSGDRQGRSVSSGSGSKPKKADKVKKSDVVKRYKEIDDALEKVTDSMEDASKVADRLYGNSRLKQMEKQNNLIKNEIELLKQKKKEALQYLEEDRQAAADAAKEAGVTLTFDENGLISNYTEAMTEIYNELDSTINSANADGNVSDSEQEKIDLIQKRADDLQSAIDQYDGTWAEIDDLDNQLDDKFYEWQDNNAEMLSYKLELKLELNDMELEEIEYELSKIEDDFYSMAEAAALMSSSNGKSQLGIYTQELADYTAQQKALEDAYKAGEISQTAYVEGMKEVRSGIYDNLSSLQELDKSMMEYYGSTLDKAAEEIAKYTDRMDHQTAVLDHYSSLLEIMGKSNDYKTMGKVLEGKAKTLSDQAAVAKETMEMYKDQAADRLAEYQNALARGDQAAAELYLEQYEAALVAASEAEDTYLSKAEEWAEALKAVLENILADASADLEKVLTGGSSFDMLATQMERANSLQEEYLTTTNKIYETNKMINTAQKEIDKTTNMVAKQKLKNFQQETSQLQSRSKLSQYELDIQQAKYELLLAEIALEEAQQSKSIVRLQRDSEGNFGYVYTADTNKMAEAEQKLADAQNNLYNIGLEGANNYTQKYQETLQEMWDTLSSLQEQYLNGEFATEEDYHRAMEEAKEYYYQKLQDYSSLYQIALTTDSRVVADAWSTDFADMTYRTSDWQLAVDDYVRQVEDAFSDWQLQMQEIARDTSFDTLEDNIEDITEESKKLKEAIISDDGVINAIEQEVNAVAEITSGYATLRETLQALMGDYEKLGKTIDQTVRKQQTAANSVSSNTTAFNAQSVGGTGGSGKGTSGGDQGNGKNPDGNPSDNETCPKCGKNKKNCKCNKNITKVYPVELAADPYGNRKMGQVDAKSVNGKRDFTITDLKTGTPYGYSFNSKKSRGYIDKTTYDILSKFNTGGYTGSWGSEGKLAMLHQKELILNADDTTNFLASLEVLREIMKVIDLHSTHAQIAGMLNSPTYYDYNEPQTLEQQVHIEVSFPNVSDRNEIEEAMTNLINRASQFVNRK